MLVQQLLRANTQFSLGPLNFCAQAALSFTMPKLRQHNYCWMAVFVVLAYNCTEGQAPGNKRTAENPVSELVCSGFSRE